MNDSSNSHNISISEVARVHIRHQLDLTQAKYLRLGVKQSGCNGYMYMLDYLEERQEDDFCISFADQVNVCVSPSDLSMVTGTEIDMITQGLNSALVFKNSNATSYCGCGESFALGGEPSSGELDPSKLGTEVGN